MSLLEKLGLHRKKVEGPPIIGEKKRQIDEQSPFKNSLIFKYGIILVFFGIVVAIIPNNTFKKTYDYQVGEPWRQEDLTAPITYPLQKSEAEIEQEKKEIRQNTPPIFHRKTNALIRVQSRLDSLYKRINPVLTAYTNWKIKQSSDSASTFKDSLRYIQLYNNSGVGLSESGWAPLLREKYYFEHDTLTSFGEKNKPEKFVGKKIKSTLITISEELLNQGILNIKKETIENSSITIRNLANQTEKIYSISNVNDMTEARDFAKFRLNKIYTDSLSATAYELFSLIIEPNLIYQPQETEQQIQEAISNISKTKGAIAKGQVIIRRGDIVTPERKNRLQSLAEARSRQASQIQVWMKFLGDSLIIASILTFLFMYLFLYRQNIFGDNWNLLLVILAMSLVLAGSSIANNYEDISPYVVPIAVAPVVLTIIFDSRVGLVTTITLALLGGLSLGNGFEFITATFTASALGVFSVRDIKNRSQFLFTTPSIIFFGYALVLLGLTLTKMDAWEAYFQNLKYLGINVAFLLLTYPIILIFEKTFKVTTDFTLLELSDTNRPLLKKLMSRAPGTFHHSLQVANLAESAASQIGANALLCRVGALYHDIGKMHKPEYFTENQSNFNAHDKLKPQMSAKVIKDHVSRGVEMARDTNLPEVLVDFIRTHHGTTLISFFYSNAKKETDATEREHEIQEEDFRYDGPIPHTRETGILLLADCIEAASRSMPKPNYNKLKALVEKMVDGRVQEGQLNNTPLTFRDIASIKEAFIKNLTAIHHGRVEYPDEDSEPKKQQKDEQNNSTDSPENTDTAAENSKASGPINT